jgi:hypothetical protein
VRRADLSSRGVLPSVVCPRVIVKARELDSIASDTLAKVFWKCDLIMGI